MISRAAVGMTQDCQQSGAQWQLSGPKQQRRPAATQADVLHAPSRNKGAYSACIVALYSLADRVPFFRENSTICCRLPGLTCAFTMLHIPNEVGPYTLYLRIAGSKKCPPAAAGLTCSFTTLRSLPTISVAAPATSRSPTYLVSTTYCRQGTEDMYLDQPQHTSVAMCMGLHVIWAAQQQSCVVIWLVLWHPVCACS